MSDSLLFTWRHFQADMILCAVRWYLRYALSYCDEEELMRERGVWVDHTTVFRWVQRDAPELDRRCRPHLKATNDSYRLDETDVKIKKRWYYLYRAVNSRGATLDFMLSATRDAGAAGILRLKRSCRFPLPGHSERLIVWLGADGQCPLGILFLRA
jgi:IS6 family transposase